MGFLKRFLSLGSSKSKKNKKKQSAANAPVDAEGRIVAERKTQDPDTSANRLLRSSSTKFSVMSAIDYTALPPLPHSVNNLLNTPPISPSPSLVTVATTPGLHRSGTYVVKVHGKTTHSRTEFPRANRPLESPTRRKGKHPKTPKPSKHDDLSDDEEEEKEELRKLPRLKDVNFTPKDTSRLYKLRRDPSVASLLNLYDDQGRLDSNVFANSPPTPAPISDGAEGREPAKRTGSTLRQLLGGPEPAFAMTSALEGDISWAERFLDEQPGNDSPPSSPSSPNLETPKDALFPDALSAPHVVPANTTLSSLDPDSSINYPAISSMEVEVSGTDEDIPLIEEASISKPPLLPDPKTPQRASEVFGFLNRRNTLIIKERDLPALPMIITPDNTGEGQLNLNNSLGENLDATPSTANTSGSTHVTTSDTHSSTSHAQIQTATMTKLSTAFAASTTSLNLLISHDASTTDHAVTGKDSNIGLSTDVSSTPAGTTSTSSLTTNHHTGSSLSSSNSMKVPPTKIPRGPRPRPLSVCHRDASSHEVPQDELVPGIATTTTTTTTSLSQQRNGTQEHAHQRKREAFTNIPQRQHRRITSRSSGRDIDAILTETNTSDSSKIPGPSNKPYQVDAPSRKRSTKPERAHVSHGKENTPSPPPSVRTSPGPGSAFGFNTMVTPPPPPRPRFLAEVVGDAPSPASSSELSPVAREMMSDLRQQRMRARQVERRRGIWVRE